MKTMGFSDVYLVVADDGTVSLLVKKPGEDLLEIRMSHDELLVFLTECTNSLYRSTVRIEATTAKKDLERERRKVK